MTDFRAIRRLVTPRLAWTIFATVLVLLGLVYSGEARPHAPAPALVQR
jgi:hypothetical protein